MRNEAVDSFGVFKLHDQLIRFNRRRIRPGAYPLSIIYKRPAPVGAGPDDLVL